MPHPLRIYLRFITISILSRLIVLYLKSQIIFAIWLVLTHDQVKVRVIDEVINILFLFFLLYKTNRFHVTVRSFRRDFRFEFEHEIEYEFSILVCRLHIITPHTHLIP